MFFKLFISLNEFDMKIGNVDVCTACRWITKCVNLRDLLDFRTRHILGRPDGLPSFFSMKFETFVVHRPPSLVLGISWSGRTSPVAAGSRWNGWHGTLSSRDRVSPVNQSPTGGTWREIFNPRPAKTISGLVWMNSDDNLHMDRCTCPS